MTTVAANLTTDEAVLAATGRSRSEWFVTLDAWDGTTRPHRDIAAWLMTEHRLDNWWAQTITVEYERARGLRPVGGGRDGLFAVSASKTIAVPAARSFAAVTDAGQRAQWLPGADLRARPTTAEFVARFDCGTDGTRVVFRVTAHGPDKSRVALMHERLRSADAADEAKAFWRERLSALETLLES